MANFIKISLVSILSSFIAFLAVESIIRGFDLGPKPLAPLPIPNYQLSKNPVIRYEFRPNYSSKGRPFDRAHVGFETNADGFRDFNYPVAKPDNIRRIIILGDSTTAGNRIRDNRRVYPKLLEQLLNSGATKKRNEVLNMGVGGYHTVQEVEMLREKGLKYTPDVVLVMFCLNDFKPESDGGVYKSLLRVNSGEGVTGQGQITRLLLNNSRFLFWSYNILKPFLKTTSDSPETWYEKNVLRGKTTVEVGFQMLSSLGKEKNFKPLFLILPGFNAPFDKYMYREIHEKVLKIGEGFPSVRIVDLTKYFQAVNNDAKLFSYDGLHMNTYGHATLAKILFKVISEEGLR